MKVKEESQKAGLKQNLKKEVLKEFIWISSNEMDEMSPLYRVK